MKEKRRIVMVSRDPGYGLGLTFMEGVPCAPNETQFHPSSFLHISSQPTSQGWILKFLSNLSSYLDT